MEKYEKDTIRSNRIIRCVTVVVIIGLLLVMLGKLVLDNDTVIIIGAMMSSMLGPLIVGIVSRIITKK